MTLDRLCDPALTNIAREKTGKAFSNDIIEEFASMKVRKVLF